MNIKETTLIRVPIKLKNSLKVLSAQRGLYLYQLLAQLLLQEIGGKDCEKNYKNKKYIQR